ncbi:unnamed protein product [Oppiella nova]|uniref:Uncharacterized protein n=1 Tax=Oppiella nova TaxID=334625 RepID=A0A7R9QNB4_9ACAR|nr:unnamed protein product [Oppiella nova]CAG2169357.1 unnamed protein product [Oppiella nova]
MGPVLCQVINTGIDLMDAHDDQLINSCKSKIYSDVNECMRDVHWDQYPDTTTDQGEMYIRGGEQVPGRPYKQVCLLMHQVIITISKNSSEGI